MECFSYQQSISIQNQTLTALTAICFLRDLPAAPDIHVGPRQKRNQTAAVEAQVASHLGEQLAHLNQTAMDILTVLVSFQGEYEYSIVRAPGMASDQT